MRVVLTSAPVEVAERLARALVSERLAACVQVVPGVTSVYRWEGEVRAEPESVLWIKVAAERVDELAARIEELHPYELPEFVVLPVDPGMTDARYLGWVRAETLETP
jgi:periplasmic divalent cation tolerance protein